MAMMERHELKGRLSIVLRDAAGTIVEQHRFDNLITQSGRMFLAKLLTGLGQVKELKIAVGSDPTPPSMSDTALKAPVIAVPAAAGEPKMTVENGQQMVVVAIRATLPAGAAETVQLLQEAGVVIGTPTGEALLYNRVVFPTITRTANLEMTLTWEVMF